MTSKDEKTTVQHSGRRQTQLRIAVVCIALVLGGLTFLTVSQHKNIQRLLLWINDHPGIGFFIFGATYVWFTVLFLPPAILALAAGAVFGLWMGIILVWGSAVTGETLAFLLGRCGGALLRLRCCAAAPWRLGPAPAALALARPLRRADRRAAGLLHARPATCARPHAPALAAGPPPRTPPPPAPAPAPSGSCSAT
jgi:hypothetical protein